jgi:hypothetical protein
MKTKILAAVTAAAALGAFMAMTPATASASTPAAP